jgi:chlorite dismutase
VGAAMHELAKKNKYMGFLFMKIRPEYFALGREGIHEVSAAHARELAKHAKQLTHVVTSGVDGRYDQVTIVEADSLEEIHAAATEFRMGAKAQYIEITDVVVGMKAPPRALAQ